MWFRSCRSSSSRWWRCWWPRTRRGRPPVWLLVVLFGMVALCIAGPGDGPADHLPLAAPGSATQAGAGAHGRLGRNRTTGGRTSWATPSAPPFRRAAWRPTAMWLSCPLRPRGCAIEGDALRFGLPRQQCRWLTWHAASRSATRAAGSRDLRPAPRASAPSSGSAARAARARGAAADAALPRRSSKWQPVRHRAQPSAHGGSMTQCVSRRSSPRASRSRGTIVSALLQLGRSSSAGAGLPGAWATDSAGHKGLAVGLVLGGLGWRSCSASSPRSS